MSDVSGGDGYHPVAKVLHWSMVLAVALQVIVGYGIDRDHLLRRMW